MGTAIGEDMPHELVTQTRSAQEAAWWRAWRDLDLSWDGLTRHQGHQSNLQDYWRTEQHRLIPEPGTQRRWTRFHCPFHFADGAPSPKATWSSADWAELHASLRTRLAMGSADRPALLTGIVLDGLWEAEAELPDADGFLFLRADQAYFRDGVDFTRNGMGLADFRGAWFGGKAIFEGARAVTAQFDGAHYADRMIQLRTETAPEPFKIVPELDKHLHENEQKPYKTWRSIAGILVLAVIAGMAFIAIRG